MTQSSSDADSLSEEPVSGVHPVYIDKMTTDEPSYWATFIFHSKEGALPGMSFRLDKFNPVPEDLDQETLSEWKSAILMANRMFAACEGLEPGEYFITDAVTDIGSDNPLFSALGLKLSLELYRHEPGVKKHERKSGPVTEVPVC